MKNKFRFSSRLAGVVARPALLTGLLCALAASSSWAALNPFRNTSLVARQEAYAPLSGGTAVAAVQANEGVSGALPIGFDFKFADRSYATVYASSNGFLSFNAALSAQPANDLAGPDVDSSPLLAALWDDLDGNAGMASYRTTGTAPSRVFTFEWRNWKWGPTATAANISFQTRLYETSGRVEYAYTSVGSAAVTGDGASIGLTDASFSSSLNGTGTSPLLDRNATHDALTTPPASGQVYALLPATPPANDECSAAALLTVAPASGDACANAYNSTNRGATASGSNITNTCIGGADAWYRFVAPASGSVAVLVAGASANLEVLGGTCGTLNSLDCGGNNRSRGIDGLTAGATYYLRVSMDNNDDDKPYTVCISALVPAPAMTNDECASATLLPVRLGACNPVNGSLNGSTLSPGPRPTCDRPPSDVWFRFAVPANGQVSVSTSLGNAVDGQAGISVAVYSGACGALTELGCSTFSNSQFYGTVNLSGRTPNEVLYARVWSYFGSSTGTFGICVNDGSPANLLVSTLNRAIQGTYGTVTITGTGSAYLTNDLTVTTALTVQDGGELATHDDRDPYLVQGSGTFAVQAGGTLSLRHAAGLSASGAHRRRANHRRPFLLPRCQLHLPRRNRLRDRLRPARHRAQPVGKHQHRPQLRCPAFPRRWQPHPERPAGRAPAGAPHPQPHHQCHQPAHPSFDPHPRHRPALQRGLPGPFQSVATGHPHRPHPGATRHRPHPQRRLRLPPLQLTSGRHYRGFAGHCGLHAGR